jgi:hypothetical protein
MVLCDSNPVRIIRSKGTKIRYVVVNEAGDELNRPNFYNRCIRWCRRHNCQPVKSWKTLELVAGFTRGRAMYAADWPRRYQAIAQRQGWDIFDADGSDDGRWQLQAIMVPSDHDHLKYFQPKFIDDREAAEFVKAAAKNGSKVAKAAIAFLVARKSKDVKKFKLA